MSTFWICYYLAGIATIFFLFYVSTLKDSKPKKETVIPIEKPMSEIDQEIARKREDLVSQICEQLDNNFCNFVLTDYQLHLSKNVFISIANKDYGLNVHVHGTKISLTDDQRKRIWETYSHNQLQAELNALNKQIDSDGEH